MAAPIPLENVGLVRRLFEQWNGGRDPAWFIQNSRAEVEIFSRYAEVEGHPFVGAAGVHRWINEIDENFERYDAGADDIRELGDTVLALGSVHYRAKGSGIEMEQPMGWVFELRDGKFSRILFYDSPRAALEATGVRE